MKRPNKLQLWLVCVTINICTVVLVLFGSAFHFTPLNYAVGIVVLLFTWVLANNYGTNTPAQQPLVYVAGDISPAIGEAAPKTANEPLPPWVGFSLLAIIGVIFVCLFVLRVPTWTLSSRIGRATILSGLLSLSTGSKASNVLKGLALTITGIMIANDL